MEYGVTTVTTEHPYRVHVSVHIYEWESAEISCISALVADGVA